MVSWRYQGGVVGEFRCVIVCL